MTPFKKIVNNVDEIVKANFESVDLDILAKCSCNPPSQKFADEFDMCINHAMILSKQLGKAPAEVSEAIKSGLLKSDLAEFFEKIEFVAGFLNMKMKAEFWHDIAKIASIKKDFFFESIGKGEKVNVEYVSANPTGPMHIGHARGAIYGDVLANVLQKSGYEVMREYYINDAGSQMDKVIESLIFRARQISAADFSTSLPEGCYPGEYLIDAANVFLAKFGKDILNDVEKEYDKIWKFTVSYMLDLIKKDLAKLGVFHDVFTSEKDLTNQGLVKKAFEDLQNKGLIYKGVLERPKRDDSKHWEEVEQFLFASKKFGDDSDRAVMKNDGSWAYFMPDIAYHFDKFKRGFSNMILVLGADHKGYKKRISAAVSAISDGKASVDVIFSELVNFVKDGKPVKMSKRAGNFLTLSDVLDEIDPQILRFFLITKKSDTVVDFDFVKVLEQSKENPIFYIQYAHTRCLALLAKIESEGIILSESEYKDYAKFITHEKQVKMLSKIAQFSKIMSNVCKNHDPHLIASFLLDLCSEFHSLYSVQDFRFVSQDINQTKGNIVFIKSIENVIKSCLECFGVKPLERM